MDRELERATRREYRRTKRVLEPKIKAALARQPLMDPEYALVLNTAQNVVRDTLSVVIAEALPQGREFFLELATRLACYCITALPADDQEVAALKVAEGILPKLADMQANGHVIQTDWE